MFTNTIAGKVSWLCPMMVTVPAA
jgi:hypothetical protein